MNYYLNYFNILIFLNYFVLFNFLILVLIIFFLFIYKIFIILIFIQYQNMILILFVNIIYNQLINKFDLLFFQNDDETPQQIQLFFSHGFNLRLFTHLQSLSLYHIHSYMIIREIIIALPNLSNLIRLKFINCCLSPLHDEYYLIDNIWKLPKLIHLQLHDISDERFEFFIPKSISSSIEYMSIKNSYVNISDIYHLLTRTPHLRYVKVYVNLRDESISITEVFPSITNIEY